MIMKVTPVQDNAVMSVQDFGIGLSISSEIIKRHHGRMQIESCKGEDATFRLRVLLAPVHIAIYLSQTYT